MATYRQDDIEYEDGYGNLKISYLFSDTWDGLFTDESYIINVVEPDKLKFKREQKIGQLALDEFKFKVNEAAFSKDDSTLVDDPKTQLDIEKDFLSLCLSSVKGALTYVGVFINSGITPSISESIYVGAINSDTSFDDIVWPGDGQFGVTPTPIREYTFDCLPSEEAVLNESSLTEIVDAIDPSWESTFVFDGAGFYKEGVIETRIPRIVHLHELLNKLASTYEDLLLANGYGTWSFTFKNSKIDGKFSPVRWGKPFSDVLYSPFVGGLINLTSLPVDGNGDTTKIYDDEARELYACASFIADSDYNGPYVPYCVVKPNINDTNDRNEYNESAAKEYQWQKIDRVDDSFTGLLYSLATDLGMSLKFEFIAQKSIRIEFVSKSTKANNSKIYIKDVIKASGEINEVEKRADEKRLRGSISYLIAEPLGNSFSTVINGLSPHTFEDGYPLNEKGLRDGGVKNLVSIGIACWEVKDKLVAVNNNTNSLLHKGTGAGFYLGGNVFSARIPYYLHLSNSSGGKYILNPITVDKQAYYGDAVPYNSVSFSNQLFMKVDKRVGETLCPDTYYTQIGRLEIKRSGVDKYYYSLADYVNGINTEDVQEFGTKYKLDIPYLMCASTSPSGSAPSLFNLGIDKIIEIDGLDFIIDDYEIDLQKRSVKLELSAVGRFDYEAATGREDTPPSGLIAPLSPDSEEGNVSTGLTLINSSIEEGEFVSRVSETEVERTSPLEAHYGRLFGVAKFAAAEDTTIDVQTSGDVEISWLSGSVNDAVFVKKVSATQNLSTTPITTKTVDEDLYAEVGRIVGTNIMRIGIKEHFIIQ